MSYRTNNNYWIFDMNANKKGHRNIIIKKDNSFYGWCCLNYLGFVIVLLFKPQKLWNVIYLALVFVVVEIVFYATKIKDDV